MIVSQVETELVAITRQLTSVTVEIIDRYSGGSGVIWARDGLVVTKRREFENTKFNWTKKTALNLDYLGGGIFADIRLAPGNSGGILVNSRGEVVGINVAIVGGLALAIPSQQVEHFTKAIVR